MKELSIATGLVEYRINDAVTVTFNPTDSGFVEKIFATFDELDKKQDEYRSEIEHAQKQEIFDIAKKRDAEMREKIDGLFGVPVCDALFGEVNVYALADGLPLWCNLMLAIMDEIDTAFAREQKMTNTRITKYSSKYHK